MNVKKIMSVALAASMLATGAVGCQKAPKEETPAADSKIEQVVEESKVEESVVETPAVEASEQPAAEVDFNNPSIIIELGDIEGIKDFAKKMQNFEIEEGTVIKITGKWSKPGMTPSVVQEDEAAGESWGVQMFFDYEQADLVDGDMIEVVGHAVKGQYFMEFHVAEGCLKMMEAEAPVESEAAEGEAAEQPAEGEATEQPAEGEEAAEESQAE